ncbi:MAG: DUF4124 domain-containing protein [Gammaproteobacteria bacterium]|nr:DUF4124 domain-containing protein [Gammaproteobacteria bacterium]
MSRWIFSTKRLNRGHMRWAGYIVAVALLFVARAEAITVHTWIDDEGVRHYADAPPTATVADSEQIVINEVPADGVDAKDDYYSIVNQWQRVRDERRESDALRLEHERLKFESRALADTRTDEPPAYHRSYGIYPYGFPYAPDRNFQHPGPHGLHAPQRERTPGFTAKRRNAFVHATPPAWHR